MPSSRQIPSIGHSRPSVGKFLFFLYKNDLKTMSDVLYRATKYMNMEDALLAHEEKPNKRERQEGAR